MALQRAVRAQYDLQCLGSYSVSEVFVKHLQLCFSASNAEGCTICRGKGILSPLQHAGWKAGSAHTRYGSPHLKMSPFGTFCASMRCTASTPSGLSRPRSTPGIEIDTISIATCSTAFMSVCTSTGIGSHSWYCFSFIRERAMMIAAHQICMQAASWVTQSHKEPVMTHYM